MATFAAPPPGVEFTVDHLSALLLIERQVWEEEKGHYGARARRRVAKKILHRSKEYWKQLEPRSA